MPVPRLEYFRHKPRRVRRPAITRQPKSFKAFMRGPNKYGAYSATYDGYTYDSRKEALYAAQLDTLKKAANPTERVLSFERQVKVPLIVNGKLITTYYCDFFVRYADGREQWEEVKGFQTREWLFKEKLFRALFPDRILKVIR